MPTYQRVFSALLSTPASPRLIINLFCVINIAIIISKSPGMHFAMIARRHLVATLSSYALVILLVVFLQCPIFQLDSKIEHVFGAL